MPTPNDIPKPPDIVSNLSSDVCVLSVPAPQNVGWPTEQACIRRLDTIVPVPPDADLLGDISNILNAVIAEFQGPVGRGIDGCGTGRTWGSVTETRVFDGTGYAELAVDDMVAGSTVVVAIDGCVLNNVVITKRGHGLGANTLSRPTGYYGYGLSLDRFPLGEQNISVTTTWGNTITADIISAVIGEVCYRALIQGYVDLAGVGDTLSLEGYTSETASGISVWAQSSPIAILHAQYQNTVRRYQDSGAWRRTRLFPSMS